MAWIGFEDIAPTGLDTFDLEPFETWFERVEHRIPNVPKGVAIQWVHEHWGGSPYEEYLPLDRMRFSLQTWSLARVMEVQVGEGWKGTHANATGRLYIDMDKSTPLGQFMIDNRTWPRPVIVLENAHGLHDAYGPIEQLRLLEGHMRLTFMHSLNHHGEAPTEHKVWAATIVD